MVEAHEPEKTSESEKSLEPEQIIGNDTKVSSEGSSEEVSKDEYPHGLTLWLLVGSVMLAIFLIALDQTIVGTAIPKITDEFHGLSQVSWYGSAYFMCLGGFQSSWGKAYKYFPLKITFLATLFLFELGSLICGVAPNPNALIVGRAISGVGGAGIVTGGTTIIAFCAEPRKRPTLMGLVGITYAVAAVCGPIVGGAFSDGVTWRWCFYVNLPIGGFAAVIIVLFFHLPSAAKTVKATWKEKLLQMDPVGIMLAMAAIICFILALEYAGATYAWNSSQVIGLLVGFVAISVALGCWEVYQGEYAMLVPRLLKNRSLWGASIFQFLFAGSFFLLLYYLPEYFQAVKGADPIQSGVDNLPMVIAIGFFVLGGGITVSVTGHAMPFMVIGSAIATVANGLFYTMNIDTSTGKWIGYQILAGASIAFPFQNCLNIAQAKVDSQDLSTASAILYFFQTLGGAFSVSSAQSAFVNRLIATLPHTAPGVSPTLVYATGSTELRSVFPASEIPGILVAYMEGIKGTFAVSIGMMGTAFLVSLTLPRAKILNTGEAMAMA
ncbi:Major facilitator superfamily domain general substrate transporter [Penicillium hispanicum]|uniref:Major facilitator superfamily domain general substrate transporter n=1 Tax=Penicillium hispanicum TaxID=1080232 RepID=UPI00253FDA38|nr:Major facilitator superfamily domain general substrate transporter [Penicillium hispanicum]KAJ5579705.1 Major facilitator superfamily domain general substrate transporter [Penicillium hispanicum]